MKEKIINQVKFIVFGIVVIFEVLIIFTIWSSLNDEMLKLSIVAIVLGLVLFWLGNKKLTLKNK